MSKVVLGPESQLRIINTVSNSPSLMSLFLYVFTFSMRGSKEQFESHFDP